MTPTLDVGGNPLLRLIALALAGGIGTLARYWLNGLAQRIVRETFPCGTLAVNVVGCFLIGLVMHLVRQGQAMSPDARTFVIVGLLGGFTTFSAFGYETFDLIRDGSILHAGTNAAGNLLLGIGAVWLGTMVGGLILT